jgi:hypothetical protein
MAFKFTERHATVFSRYLEINKADFLARTDKFSKKTSDEFSEELDDEGNLVLCKLRFQNARVKVEIEYDRNEYGDEEIIPSSAKCLITVKYYDVPLGSHYIELDSDDKNWIFQLVKDYTMCKCKEYLAVKDGWCKDCYPYVCTQEENCCVCMENEGVWCELECKHKLHKSCWKQTIGDRCPLCRETTQSKNWVNEI